MATLQALYLSITDDRFSRFDYNRNRIFDEELEKDETSSIIYSLADGARTEDGWQELLRKFAQLHYDLEAMSEHRRDIERYVRLKMATIARNYDNTGAYNRQMHSSSLDSVLELPRPTISPSRPQGPVFP
jgi:hypothetical protein